MEKMTAKQFLSNFPDHVFRFIDQTGEGRPAHVSAKYRKDLNESGYEAYFTVNGFANFAADGDCKLERMTSVNSFFVDIDGRKDEAELEAIRAVLMPTFVIETMRGYHLYWLLDEALFRDEMTETEWSETVKKWEGIEAAVVAAVKGDPVVKDATRILRVPGTHYWKKSGDAWKGGVDKAPFKVSIVSSNIAYRYTMDQVSEKFPAASVPMPSAMAEHAGTSNRTRAEKDDFFRRVDEKYAVEDRDSWKSLISGLPGTIPDEASRNMALLVTATLARRAGWTEKETYDTVASTGWHGMVAERGSEREMRTTITSAFKGGYIFGKNHPMIEFNTTDSERLKIDAAYAAVMKDRKDQDKLRFSTYENEILARHPHLKRNEGGVFFDYEGGCYRMLSQGEMSKLILDCIYEDMLWGYRTGRNVADKVMCLLAIVPRLRETADHGRIVNVKNGLLDIVSLELKPHTPDFVSLVQFPVEYDPNAKAPIWEGVVSDWVQGPESEEKKLMLQQYSGYCLSSSTKYAKALFLIGDGGNGKSTYADTMTMVIGPQATSRIKLESLHKDFGLVGLVGKRLNVIEEVSSNYFHSDIIKALISGEEVTTEMKYQSQFTFKPQAKFIFAVNRMPRVDDSSSGMERRILSINFNGEWRKRPNTDLRDRDGLIAQELPGVLNWMLEGARSLHEAKHFADTDEQRNTIQEYREENSSVDGFMAECTTEKEGNVMYTTDLYEVYRDFCRREGRASKSHISFSKELRSYANKTHKISFVPRINGRQKAQIEGIELATGWERNFATTFDTTFHDPKSYKGF